MRWVLGSSRSDRLHLCGLFVLVVALCASVSPSLEALTTEANGLDRNGGAQMRRVSWKGSCGTCSDWIIPRALPHRGGF